MQTRQELRSDRKEVAEYFQLLWKRNGHTGFNIFPGMPVAELWIGCMPLENLFCLKPQRLSITWLGDGVVGMGKRGGKTSLLPFMGTGGRETRGQGADFVCLSC